MKLPEIINYIICIFSPWLFEKNYFSHYVAFPFGLTEIPKIALKLFGAVLFNITESSFMEVRFLLLLFCLENIFLRAESRSVETKQFSTVS